MTHVYPFKDEGSDRIRSQVFDKRSATEAPATAYQPLDPQLTDLAGLAYGSNALKVVRVNAGETGFELATVSAGSTPAGTGLYGVTAGVMDAAAVTIGAGLDLTAGVLTATGSGSLSIGVASQLPMLAINL